MGMRQSRRCSRVYNVRGPTAPQSKKAAQGGLRGFHPFNKIRREDPTYRTSRGDFFFRRCEFHPRRLVEFDQRVDRSVNE